jgi:hypothetical protein
MTQTLERLAADVALRHELGENGRALAETRFNWQAVSPARRDLRANRGANRFIEQDARSANTDSQNLARDSCPMRHIRRHQLLSAVLPPPACSLGPASVLGDDGHHVELFDVQSMVLGACDFMRLRQSVTRPPANVVSVKPCGERVSHAVRSGTRLSCESPRTTASSCTPISAKIEPLRTCGATRYSPDTPRYMGVSSSIDAQRAARSYRDLHESVAA